jgi:basic membrane protein A and related proteins
VRIRTILAGALVLVASAALVVATTAPATTQAGKAAVITDIGGLGDKGFNDLCAKGLATAKRQLGVSGRVFISKSAADYIPNLSTAARQGYNPIVTCGFLMGTDIEKAANRFKNTSFGIIDYSNSFMKSRPKNLRGALFAENQAGYLAGVAAVMGSKTKTVSFVGGQAVPAVVAFRAGYIAGAKATKKGVKVTSAYSEDFVDQAKCKEIALNQIAAGSGVVFAAAGQCGLGALQAAKERGVWGIGVDTDQAFLGPHILTSATKKVDLGVLRLIRDVEEGTFEGGTDTIYTVKNQGVGFGKVSAKAANRKAIIAKLTAVSKLLAAGKIKPPTK